jgi:hypothetical protein
MWDVAGNFVALIVLVFGVFVFAWHRGRGSFVALVLALYGSYAAYIVFPFTELLPSEPALTAFIAKIALYLVFLFIFYSILHRVIAPDFVYLGTVGTVILSVFVAAFLLSLAYHLFAVTDVYPFSPVITTLFAGDASFFWWFIAPVVGLFIFAH